MAVHLPIGKEGMMTMEQQNLSVEQFLRRLIEGHRQAAESAERRIRYLMDTPIEKDSVEAFAAIFEELVKHKEFAQRAADSLKKELLN